jgi:thioredoxin reductase
METTSYDVAIVGGGAAGLSGALVLGRARRRVVVVDAGAPRNAPARHMHGFLSRDGMPPAELLAAGRAELGAYGVDVLDDEVVAAGAGFTLTLKSGGPLAARRLLVATGAVDRLPDIPGVRERWGKDFLHCPYCHGWEVRDELLGVLGADAASVEYAHLLRQWSADVVFFAHTHALLDSERSLLEARGIRVVDGTVARLDVVDDRLAAIELTDGRSVPCAALFMRPTLQARSRGLLAGLGCETDEDGFARVDGTGRTTASGVWAAGNAANPRAQVITAAGEGSAAAIAINADLVREDIGDGRP